MGTPSGGSGGFIRPAGATRADGIDLFVEWRDAKGAINGDKVMAEAIGTGYDGRLKGRVIKIIERTTAPIPAMLQKQFWGWRAEPLDPKMQQFITVPSTTLASAGDYVTVLLDPDPSKSQIKGTVLARLGRPTDLKIENRLTAAMFNIRTDFPVAVMDELSPLPTQVPDEWSKGREDLRELLTVTIDPPTAKDFDDAISLERLPKEEGGGWILGVHIADVSHYVKENGPLDQEAQLRGTSVYFPDECIPMLPDRLSSELCSLKEGVDRLTMTAWITISPQLEVVEKRFSNSIINSRKRLTYGQVKEACIDLDERTRHEIGKDVCQMLEHALALSRRLTEKRLDRGALMLESEETEYIFDAKGLPIDARRYEIHDAHTMIEEYMLMANEAVAQCFTQKNCPSIFRIHEEPDPLKLDIFKNIAVSLGLLRPKDKPTPELLNALLKKIHGGPLEMLLNTMLLRSLKRAEYSAENVGHSGLALSEYLHFTSPIRRYPDLVVHRLLKKLLKGEKFRDGLQSHLAILAKRASDSEQTATEAERENSRWKTCLLMKPKIGQKFQGIIQGFSSKAAFVRLDSPFVEVGVPLGALGGRFSIDEHRTKAVGMRGQIELPIGAQVLVEITSIDENQHRVSAWMLEAKTKDASGKTITFTPTLTGPTSLREADFVEAGPRGRTLPRSRGRGRAESPKKPARKKPRKIWMKG